MWSNENFILAPLEIKHARQRLLISGIFVISIFLYIISQIITFSFQEKKEPLYSKNFINQNIRADITDRNGNILATSIPAWSVFVDPKEVLEPNKSANILHKLMPEKDLDTLIKKLNSNKRYEEIDRISSPNRHQLILDTGITGVHFTKINTRLYPKGDIASHILGNVNRDGKGQAGVEIGLNDRLSSSLDTIRLTIDTNIQFIVQTELKKQIDFFDASSGAGIVLDIRNGEILAVSSLPNFDANYFGEASDEQRFNRATFGNYDMGSTFKLINTAIAIDSGLVKLEDVFDTTKPIFLGKHKIEDFRYLKKPANVAQILVNSSNIGSALIAKVVGPKIQKRYFDLLELTKAPNLPILEISQPIYDKNWPKSTSITASYGYGIAVSPIQLASAIACIFNDGKFIKPKLIIDNQKEVVKKIFKSDTSLKLRKLARAVVTHPDGSGKKANAYGYLVGGKTGTAEKVSVNGGFKKNTNLTSFVGAFPIHEPKYLVLVLIDEPKPQIKKLNHRYTTGGHVAAPVVKEIIKKIAPVLNVHPIDTNLPNIEQALELNLLNTNLRKTNAPL